MKRITATCFQMIGYLSDTIIVESLGWTVVIFVTRYYFTRLTNTECVYVGCILGQELQWWHHPFMLLALLWGKLCKPIGHRYSFFSDSACLYRNVVFIFANHRETQLSYVFCHIYQAHLSVVDNRSCCWPGHSGLEIHWI